MKRLISKQIESETEVAFVDNTDFVLEREDC